MAWTVKPINRNGTLEIYEDGEKIGTGRMYASANEQGMVTLTLKTNQLLVMRVPIDWVQALAQLPE